MFDVPATPKPARTIGQAIDSYLASADFRTLAKGSQDDYRRILEKARKFCGHVQLLVVDDRFVDDYRTAYAAQPAQWNALRSRMILVEKLHRKRTGSKDRPWSDSARLKEKESDAHRPWPPKVLLEVMRAATPEFRALLTGYLLTAQRGSDVTTWSAEQYDPAARTLTFRQVKTNKPMTLHVPESLAAVLDAMRGRHETRLFVTPRGKAWNTINAQETLRTLLRNLKVERYTLHGLRATGPTALKMLGFENRSLRTLTGHTSDQNLETYLRGVDGYQLAQPAQEALAGAFAELLAGATGEGANRRRFSGVTGKAARKAAE